MARWHSVGTVGRLRAVRVCLVLALLVSEATLAQQAVDPERTAQALARAQALLQQLSQQKTALEVEVNQMRVEVAKSEKALKGARARIESLEASLAEQEAVSARLDRDLNNTSDRLERRRTELAEMTRKFQEKSKDFDALGNVKQRVDEQLAETEEALKVSEFNNVQLYKLNASLMTRLADKGWYEMMLQKEPFTGLVDAKIKALLQEYAAKQYEFLNPKNDALLDATDTSGDL